MAHTKQMPRNPNVDRPTTAMGSDVQPERKTPSKPTSKKLPMKGGKTTPKAFTIYTNKVKQIPYRRNQETSYIPAWTISIKRN